MDAYFADLSEQSMPGVYTQIVEVYRAALGQPPYEMHDEDVRRFSETLLHHASREGFRGYVARSRTHGRIIGFVYGYTSKPGLWWREIVERALGAERTRQWLEDAFEVVELAVHPLEQGKGIGAHLHDTLLQDLPYRTAILSTAQAETIALKMYQRRGWTTLEENFLFPGTQIEYRIMGLVLGQSDKK
jgi:ribosomal protein S18 acetylase RimI-like enzyme